VNERATGSVVSLEPRRPLDASAATPVEREPLVLVPARRPDWPTLAALAIASGVVAIGLGGWAIFSVAGSDPATNGAQLDRALPILTAPGAERIALRGSLGRLVLVVAPDDAAVLALSGLGPAADGREYAIWVVPPGSATPVAAGAFQGSERIVPVRRPVPPGARVGVTLEDAGGAERPTRTLRLVAERR
jgi:hypothetical protein